MKYAILWDWDNTLVDTFEAIFAAHNATRKHYNQPPFTREECKQAMNTSSRALFKDTCTPRQIEEIRKIYLDAYAKNASQIQLKSGAKDILQFANNKGFINIVASNKSGPVLRHEVDQMGCTQYFERVIGAEDAKQDKPSKIFTDMALSGFEFDRVISVGDGKADIQMAHNYENGIGILVWSDVTTPEFAESKPDFVSSDFIGVQSFLEQLSPDIK